MAVLPVVNGAGDGIARMPLDSLSRAVLSDLVLREMARVGGQVYAQGLSGEAMIDRLVRNGEKFARRLNQGGAGQADRGVQALSLAGQDQWRQERALLQARESMVVFMPEQTLEGLSYVLRLLLTPGSMLGHGGSGGANIQGDQSVVLDAAQGDVRLQNALVGSRQGGVVIEAKGDVVLESTVSRRSTAMDARTQGYVDTLDTPTTIEGVSIDVSSRTGDVVLMGAQTVSGVGGTTIEGIATCGGYSACVGAL